MRFGEMCCTKPSMPSKGAGPSGGENGAAHTGSYTRKACFAPRAPEIPKHAVGPVRPETNMRQLTRSYTAIFVFFPRGDAKRPHRGPITKDTPFARRPPARIRFYLGVESSASRATEWFSFQVVRTLGSAPSVHPPEIFVHLFCQFCRSYNTASGVMRVTAQGQSSPTVGISTVPTQCSRSFIEVQASCPCTASTSPV